MNAKTVERWSSGLLLVAMLVAVPLSASAAVGDRIRLQGRLVSAAGAPVPDGDYGVTVAFYAAKTDVQPLSKHPIPAVKVVKGVFACTVGESVSLPLAKFYAGEVGWVGIKVGSETELPRLPLSKVPYAIMASRAQGLACTGCVTAAQLDSKVLAPYAKSASLHKVATTGSYAALSGKPTLAKLGQSCPKGQFATGLQADGKVGCAPVVHKIYTGADFALSGMKCVAGAVMRGIDANGKPICVKDQDTNTQYKSGTGLKLDKGTFGLDLKYADARYVNEQQVNAIDSSMIGDGQVKGMDLGAGAVTTGAIKDGAVSAAKLGEPCKEGEIMSRQGGKWQCASFASVANPGPNLIVNPTLRDMNKSGYPDHTWIDSAPDNYKYVQLSEAEYHGALGGSGVNELAGYFGVDLRSTGIKGKQEAMTVYKRLTPWTNADVLVSCSVYVRRPDKSGTNAKAKLTCYGVSKVLTIKNSDASWHRLEVTARVRSTVKVPPTFMVFGSGPRTGGDIAWLRYALPKVEYGRLATAWNSAGSGVPRGMIAFFAGSYGCPPGWKEYTALRGRVIVGTNTGGKNGYTRGTPLKPNGTRTITSVPAHTHSINPPTTATTLGGEHTHWVDPPNTGTTLAGSHTHWVDPPSTYTSSAGSHHHTAYAPNHDVNSASSQGYPAGNSHQSFRTSDRARTRSVNPLAIGAAGNHNHTVNIGKFASQAAGVHGHSVNIGKFKSQIDGKHAHTVNIPTFTSGSTGSSAVDVSMPYINLIACQAQ